MEDELFCDIAAWYAVAMVRGSPNPRHFTLPARLRKARKLSGLTRSALSKKVGRNSVVAGYIEDGERLPTVGTVARLAAGLGVTASWLAYGLGEMTNTEAAATCDEMGARLQAMREARSLSKAELGRLAGLTAPSISQIERGGQSGVAVVEALAKALSVSPAWLAFNQGPRELPTRRNALKLSKHSGSITP